MIFRATILFLAIGLGASEARAEGAWISDAFGLYRADSDAVRDGWSGMRVTGNDRIGTKPDDVAALRFFVGPKSFPAGNHQVQLVAMALDEAGNLVADGLGVAFAAGQEPRPTRTTRGGIAHLLHDAGTVAGDYAVGAISGKIQSQRATYRVTAEPDSITPILAPIPPLTPEIINPLILPDMTDRFGNLVEDGTGLTLWLTDSRGRGARLDAEVIGGGARARFLLRDMAGPLGLQAQMGPAVSARLAVQTLPLRMQGQLEARSEALPEIGAERVIIGPFRTTQGHLLHDGSAVRISVTRVGGGTQVYDTWLSDGHAELVLPAEPGAPPGLTVESALGIARPQLTVAKGSNGVDQ